MGAPPPAQVWPRVDVDAELAPVIAAMATYAVSAVVLLAAIGVVGWFPFIPQLKNVATVEVFEKDPKTGYALTDERAARMAQCDGLCITASALINGTIDGLLAAAPASVWKLLVGPSAPLCQETLELGFDAVCGARVSDSNAVVRVLQEGGCFQQIKRTGGVRLLNLEK